MAYTRRPFEILQAALPRLVLRLPVRRCSIAKQMQKSNGRSESVPHPDGYPRPSSLWTPCLPPSSMNRITGRVGGLEGRLQTGQSVLETNTELMLRISDPAYEITHQRVE